MTAFFDILIVLIIAATAIPAVILLFHRYKNNGTWEGIHRKPSLTISLLLLFGTLLVIYGSFIEPLFLITNYQDVEIKLNGNTVRALVVSDIHVGDYNKRKEIKKIAQRIVSLEPDIVFIVGDHILATYKEDDRLDYLDELKIVASTIPTYAVYGNHDYGIGGGEDNIQKRYRLPNKSKEVKDKLESVGIRFLVNETEKININESEFLLFGGDEYLTSNLDFSSFAQMQEKYPNLPSIALIHNPAGIYAVGDNKVNLVISGHTHGGQVRLPFIGNIMKIEIAIPKEWYQGLNKYNNTQLFVTSGVNESSARSRLFNPPEVVLLNIH
ncbi:MAG: metallophosphoesterase [bacterium]|nr:metallophosphoesterase [bacterium]